MDAEYDTIPKALYIFYISVICIRDYCIPIFLSLSLVSNSLSVYVLFCTKLRYHSSSIYLGALAMSDIGVLTSFMMWLHFVNILYYENWLIALFFGLRWLFCFLSVWIVVAFTVQRYIAIKWPLRCSLCTVNRAIIILIRLAGLAVLYSIPWFILSSIFFYNLLPTEINETNILGAKIVSAIEAIITFVLPAIMIAFFNVLIMYNIRKQNRIRRNMISSSSASNKKTQSSDNEESHIQVTKMLVIISSLFICLNIPQQVVVMYIVYDIQNKIVHELYPIGIFLNLINYGINFVLYSATGKNFRKELICIFTKCSDSRMNEGIDMKNFAEQCD
ncbi:probable G-protein coupled receptor 139 [Linepithema humile]|uniref:probable G-protein coupled receptor 139 n=1 Tax=Linepithema humile TaxID=83485 RepID=UPI00351F6977